LPPGPATRSWKIARGASATAPVASGMRSSLPTAAVSRTSSPSPWTQTKARSPSAIFLQPVRWPGFRYTPSTSSWSVLTACKVFGLSSVNRASLIRFTLCTAVPPGAPVYTQTRAPGSAGARAVPRSRSEPRARRGGGLLVQELRHAPAHGDEHHQDDPVQVGAVQGGEVVRHHHEHERHAHVRVVLGPQPRERDDRCVRRRGGALHASADLTLRGPDTPPDGCRLC